MVRGPGVEQKVSWRPGRARAQPSGASILLLPPLQLRGIFEVVRVVVRPRVLIPRHTGGRVLVVPQGGCVLEAVIPQRGGRCGEGVSLRTEKGAGTRQGGRYPLTLIRL